MPGQLVTWSPVIAALGLAILAPHVQAADCPKESEPNDQPVQARAFTGLCAAGTLGGDDRQDIWAWSVDSENQLWQFEIDGVPNALTRVEIFTVKRDAAGNVRGSDVHLDFEARGGSATSSRFFISPGNYFIGVATAGASGAYELRRIAHELPDAAANGASLSGAFAISGKTNARFNWVIGEDDARQRWQLMLRTPLGSRYSLDLLDEGRRPVKRRITAVSGTRSLTNLGLAAGKYIVEVEGKNQPPPFTLEAIPLGERSAGIEEEPNDNRKLYPIDPALGMTGILDGDPMPADYFDFEGAHTREGRRTAIDLRTDSSIPRKLCLHNSALRELQCRSGVGLVTLSNLVLSDERYVVRVEGRADANAEYRLSFSERTALSPLDEAEPNDAFWHAPELDPRGVVQGELQDRETDVFRFRASGTAPQLWRIQATGTGLQKLEVQDARGDVIAMARKPANAERIRLSPLLLLPGTHYLSVTGQSGNYRLRALSLGQPDPDVESEPNDAEAAAMPLAFGQTRRGVLRVNDNDRYRFRLLNRERVRLTVTPPQDQKMRLRLTPAAAFGSPLQSRAAGEPIVYEGWLLPGSYGAWLDAQPPSLDAYSVQLQRLPGFTVPVELDQNLGARLEFEANSIAAFSEWQQQLSGRLEIVNRSSQTRSVMLETHLSDDAIDLTLERSTLDVAAGETQSLAASLTVPADVHAPLEIQIGVREGERVAAVGRARVTPSGDRAPVNPGFAWLVPETLRGAVDVAATGLGSRVVASAPLKEEARLMQHDQFAPEGVHRIAFFDLRRAPLPLSLTTRLRGSEAVPVLGIALHPQNPAGKFPTVQQVQDFELQLSVDGQRFETVLSGTLGTLRREQFFALETPRPARTARLVIKSNYGDTNRVVLDSWKVLAPADTLGGGVNLADPDLGGHLVRFDLQSGQRHDFAAPASPLVPGKARWALSCFGRSCKASTFVVGFHLGRAADIVSVEWREAALAKDARIPEVKVSVSADTPVGPWQTIGEIRPADGAHGTHTLKLDNPATARYVRFEIPADIAFPAALPELVRVIERNVDSDYRSILGEWGWREAVASAEWRQPPEYGIDQGSDGNDDRSAAALLTQPVTGSVRIGADEDFYRIEVGDSVNTLHIDLGGSPTVGAKLGLIDARGNPYPLVLDPDLSAPTRERWLASVTPGSSYVLRVFEPPRSVMFAWDTSGSVAPFRPVIWQALMRFSSSITPGREAVNLLPFGVYSPLLEEWQDEPTLIWRALQDHQRSMDSSETGKTLLIATEALALRSGSRSIVLIGDIAQPTYDSAELWQALATVKPHVYPLRVAHSGIPQQNSELAMRHWAAVNAGDARDTPLVDDLELGFARAAARLRRAATYRLAVNQVYVEPPGPGQLRVASRVVEREAAEPTVLGNTAVEIILDASGSMQQRIGGKRRIDVAKETLTELLTQVVPEGTPLALRVFGHLEGNYSCRTDLVQALAPLDRGAAETMIAPIQPQNLAATPIAASLRQVSDDLTSAPGQKIVVLLTDGEETCDGDPAAEIRALRNRGIEVRLNIVGFAIDDSTLKATFAEWAKLGGGTYFDVPDADALGTAISRALRVPFRILDDAGKEVATGSVNGDPVELAAGTYTVEVSSEPPLRQEVIVIGEREQTLVVAD